MMSLKETWAGGIAACVLLSISSTGRAQPQLDSYIARFTVSGNDDTSFNGSGANVSTLSGDDQLLAVAPAAGSKLVACGSFHDGSKNQVLVVRYNANGTPDTTFGWLGATTVSTSQPHVVSGCKVDPDGKVVVVSTYGDPSTKLRLMRFTSSGALDSSFGIGATGILSLNFPGSTQVIPHGLALYPNGKIVTTGIVDEDVFVTRHLTNGFPDAGFGTDGVVRTHIGAFNAGLAIAVDASDRVLVTGVTGLAFNNGSMTVLRYDSAGQLDSNFDSDGIRTVQFLGWSWSIGTSITTDSMGRIIVGGMATSGSDGRLAVARLQQNGGFDNTFSGDGRVTATLSGSASLAHGVAVATDGKIVAAGAIDVSGSGRVLLARFTATGALDTTFHTDGLRTETYPPRSNARAYAVLLDANNKPVTVGIAY